MVKELGSEKSLKASSNGETKTPENEKAARPEEANRRAGIKINRAEEIKQQISEASATNNSSIAEANESDEANGLIEDFDEKIDTLFALTEDSITKPDDYRGKEGYTETGINESLNEVRHKKSLFKKYLESLPEDKKQAEIKRQRLAKAAEAFISIGIKNEFLVPYSDKTNINHFEELPISEFDDIVNGADKGINIIFNDGSQLPLVFDVTTSSRQDIICDKLFRGDKDDTEHHNETDMLGQTHLEYGKKPVLDKNGAIIDEEYCRMETIPRFTISLPEKTIEGIIKNNLDIPKGIEDTTEVESVIPYKPNFIILEQIVAQSEFYLIQAELEAKNIKKALGKTSDPAKIAELQNRAAQTEQKKESMRKINEVFSIAARITYINARNEAIKEIKAEKKKKGIFGQPTSEEIRDNIFAPWTILRMIKAHEGYGGLDDATYRNNGIINYDSIGDIDFTDEQKQVTNRYEREVESKDNLSDREKALAEYDIIAAVHQSMLKKLLGRRPLCREDLREIGLRAKQERDEKKADKRARGIA